MNLYEKWLNLIQGQTDDTFEKFWQEYSDAEIRIYSNLLETPLKTVSGTFEELADRFDVSHVLFMGFLDGIQTSLKRPYDLNETNLSSPLELEFDAEKLFFNMLVAEAEHLYELPQWDRLLTEDEKKEIIGQYKKSRTVVKEKEPGRNDPCPCGSGKKYKKCCGANQ